MGKSERENELAAFEARLGAFRPGASRLDRDRVMYLAGQAAVRRERTGPRTGWAWPSAFAAMTAVAAIALAALVVGRRGTERYLSAPVGETPPKVSVPGPSGLIPTIPAGSDMDQSRLAASGQFDSAETLDLDAMLAQLPTGRGLPEGPPWRGRLDLPADDLATLPTSRPSSYVQHRQMLMEEMMSVQPSHASPL